MYPDPVRVVSVANSVEDLVADPSNEAWGLSSVEFCGGTHVGNTKEAQAFAITEETAVAKVRTNQRGLGRKKERKSWPLV